MRKITKRTAAIATAAVLGVGAAGAAWAWSIGAIGSTTATAATVTSLGVTATITEQLYPTGNADVAVVVTNPNAFPVVISAANLAVSGAPSGCSNASVTAANPIAVTPTVTVPAKVGGVDGTANFELEDALTMLASASQNCAGGSFTVGVNLTANTPAS